MGQVECFKEAPEQGGSRSRLADKTGESARRRGGSGPLLLCKLCRSPITTRGDAIEVEGKHEHTFFNPAGLLYEIGCFGAAPGCKIFGSPTTTFAWFEGHAWQFATCADCGTHLGWYFSAGSNGGFHGLITNRLVEEEGAGPPPGRAD